ncbi:MAG: metallophosphoesterase [Oscillospiraceae bacterium]|nr:metallophosphoesterase [Oscillospiraceae bacterium]
MELVIIIAIITIILIIASCVWQNKVIITTEYVLKKDSANQNLDGFRIINISDLHNNDYNESLISIIRNQNPNIIVITGDLINKDEDVDISLKLIRDIINIAPVFYVQGNHESCLKDYNEFADLLTSSGVKVLDNTSATVCYKNTLINFIGIMSPKYRSSLQTKLHKTVTSSINNTIKSNCKKGILNILLAHNPELIKLYSKSGVDLVLSGHAHGGMVRLPFIGGLVASNQGLFPKYTSGIHTIKNTSMVVSRGIGNHMGAIRIFNKPEVVTVILKANV